MHTIKTLADLPDHLLKRGGHEHHDRRRAISLTRWVESNCANRPSLWELHEERVRRGLEKPYDVDAALASIRQRRDGKHTSSPRRQRRQAAA